MIDDRLATHGGVAPPCIVAQQRRQKAGKTYGCVLAIIHLGRNKTQKAIEGRVIVADQVLKPRS